MPPKTHYARNGDVRIAYQVVGDGPIDLVLTPGFVSHVDLWWMFPEAAAFVKRLASFSRLILYDKRGTGLSDPAPGLPALEERMEDLHAVLDAIGSERSALLGISEGGPMSLLFAATYPERTTSLALVGSFARAKPRPGDPPEGAARMSRARAAMEHIIEHWGEGELVELMAPSFAGEEAVARGIGLYERLSSSPAMARALVDAAWEIDVSHVLGAISAPTLIVHRRDELVIPIYLAHELADEIAGARMIELPGRDHIPWFGRDDEILDPLEEHFTGSRTVQAPQRALVTVMFTDIVGSTERAAAMGDERWGALLEGHDQLVASAVTGAGGRVVKSLGDGYLASFDGPARAIGAAREIVSAAPERLGVEIRAGVHTAECELRGEDLGGMGVHIGARIAAQAGGGEVLVSAAVRDLVIGSPIGFTDRGTHELKGVPGEWQLLAIDAEAGSGVPVAPASSPNALAPNATETRLGDRAMSRLARSAPGVGRAVARVSLAGARRRAAERERADQ